jgi:hypothetical protein
VQVAACAVAGIMTAAVVAMPTAARAAARRVGVRTRNPFGSDQPGRPTRPANAPRGVRMRDSAGG